MAADEKVGGGLLAQVDEAKRLLTLAETELNEAVAQLAPADKGDKRFSSPMVDVALDKLITARNRLAEARKLLDAHEATARGP